MVRALVLVCAMSPGFAFAKGTSAKKAFRRGVCVGQNLAAAGVDVESTDLKNLTDEQRAVFKTAIEDCKEKQSNASAATDASTETSTETAPSAIAD